MAPMIMPPYSLPRMAAPPRYMPAHASGYGHPPLRSSYYPSSRSSLYHVQPSRYPYSKYLKLYFFEFISSRGYSVKLSSVVTLLGIEINKDGKLW